MELEKILVLSIFILMYVFIVIFSDKKTYVTGIAMVLIVTIMFAFQRASIMELVKSIKFDVLFMLLGIMLTVGVFTLSGMPNKLADKMISKIPNSVVALILLSVLSGLISAFVDNVATVLMLAPIGLAVAKKIDISPIPVLISISVSSNLQGAATLVGDTTSIMLADAVGMSFFDFFFMNGKFSIFWAVELGALVTVPILYLIFRKSNKKMVYESENIQVNSMVPTYILLLNMLLLVVSSFVSVEINLFGKNILNGVICLVCGISSLIYYVLTKKGTFKSSVNDSIDWQTIFFLLFLFIIIGSVDKIGIIKDLSNLFAKIGGKNIFLLYTIIVFGSVFLSAFIDNIPYVATMLPVIAGISNQIPGLNPVVLYFGLLIGATLGGNITPFGASANVVAIGALKKEGYKVKNADFFKIGIPFTMAAVLVGYLFCWLVWA